MGRPPVPARVSQSSGLDAISDELFIYNILPRIISGRDLVALAGTSRRLRKLACKAPVLCFRETLFPSLRGSRRFSKLLAGVARRAVDVRHLEVVFGRSKICSAWLQELTDSMRKSLHTLVFGGNLEHLHFSKAVNDSLGSVFSCSSLQALQLQSVWLSHAPLRCSQLPNLQRLHLFHVELCDESLDDIVALCPQLQSLRMEGCKGLDFPHICSSSILDLVFHGPENVAVDCIYVSCPSLQHLSLRSIQEVQLDDASSLHSVELMSCPKNGIDGSLVALKELRLSGTAWRWSLVERLVREIRGLHMLQLSIELDSEKLCSSFLGAVQELGELCLSLRHLHLTTSSFCAFQAMSERVEVQEGIITKILALRELTIDITSWQTGDKEVLEGLLHVCPHLDSFQVIVGERLSGITLEVLSKLVEELCAGRSICHIVRRYGV